MRGIVLDFAEYKNKKSQQIQDQSKAASAAIPVVFVVNASRITTYHEDRQCRMIRDKDVTTVPKEELTLMLFGIKPCKFCCRQPPSD